jgi:hypothetical protein
MCLLQVIRCSAATHEWGWGGVGGEVTVPTVPPPPTHHGSIVTQPPPHSRGPHEQKHYYWKAGIGALF